jgi:hypothetical protein
LISTKYGFAAGNGNADIGERARHAEVDLAVDANVLRGELVVDDVFKAAQVAAEFLDEESQLTKGGLALCPTDRRRAFGRSLCRVSRNAGRWATSVTGRGSHGLAGGDKKLVDEAYEQALAFIRMHL